MFAATEPRNKKRFLGNHADLPAELAGIGLPHVDAVDADLPGIAFVQAGR